MRTILILINALIIMTVGCTLFTEQVAPDDFNPWHHKPEEVDTTASAVLIDTCDQLVNMTDTAFLTVGWYFINGSAGAVTWKYLSDGHIDQIQSNDLVTLLEIICPQFDYTFYQNGDAFAVIVDGTDNTAFQFDRVWARDAIGQIAIATEYPRGFNFFGALTPTEATYEASHRYNIRTLYNSNTPTWTADEQNTYYRTGMHFDTCKAGEWIVDAKNPLILQSVIDSAMLYEWDEVRQ
jgi:hypothetical protein